MLSSERYRELYRDVENNERADVGFRAGERNANAYAFDRHGIASDARTEQRESEEPKSHACYGYSGIVTGADAALSTVGLWPIQQFFFHPMIFMPRSHITLCIAVAETAARPDRNPLRN